MVDSIKITALQDIGANIAYTTLVPVVNMAGTPTTQKSNLQNLGNLILNGAGGSYFPRAAQATLALSVANAAQPNITSVGTLTSLAVTGNINAGNVNGGNIVVANFYYGDGGFLTNVSSGSNYSNSNVANYLPNYTGNVGANWVIASYFMGNGHNLTFLPGANVQGTVANASYAANAGAANTATSATTAGTVTTAAQPNITSVGTLTNLSVSGNATVSGNLTVAGNLVYVNVTTLSVVDPIIDLQTGPNGTPPVANSGKDVGTALNYYDTQARVAFMGWDVSNAEFGLASQSSITNEVVTFNQYGNLRVGNIIGNGQALTGINGANVTGIVSHANVAEYVNVQVANSNITTYSLALVDWIAGNHRIEAELNTLKFNANTHTLTTINVNANVITSNYFAGNGSNLSNIAGANVNGTVANANYATSAGSATTAGTVTTNAQPNITSVGTLSNLTVTGNVSANYFVGTATNVTVAEVNNNYSYHMAFVTGAGDTSLHMDADDNLQYNPADGTMTVTRLDSGYLAVNQSVISNLNPLANVTQDLGNTTNRWKDIWLANSTIHMGDATISANGNSIVVDSITVTDGNVGTIGNVASLNLDGSNSNVLYGNGVFAPASGGGGNVSELVNGNNSFVLDSAGNVVFEGTPSGNAVDRGLVWDYGANANGVNSMIRQDNSGLTVRAWTENAGNYAAPVNIITSQDANTNTWTFDGQGNLTVPSGSIKSINDGGQLGAYVTLTPDLGLARLAGRSSEYTENFNSGGWTSASYTGTQVDITDAPNLLNFVSNNTIFTSAVDRTFSINGGEPVPYTGYGASGNNVTLYTDITADPDPTVVTSIDFYYQSESSVAIDYDDGTLNINATGLTINLDNDQTSGPDINLRSGDDILLQAKNKALGSESEGGDINIYAGDGASDDGQGNTASTGGDIQIEAGNGGDGNSSSGSAGGFTTLRAGTGGYAGATTTAGSGGYVEIRGGNGGGDGGNTALGAGGGYVSITAGGSTQEAVNGAAVTINSGQAGPNALAGNVEISTPASANGPGGTWRFDGNGLLSLPGDSVKIGSQYGSQAILASNVAFGIVSQGTSGMTALQWTDDVSNTSQFSAVYINDLSANVGDIQIRTGAVGNANIWKFGNDGNLTLPSNTFSVNYANGTQVSLGGGGGNTGNVTFDNVTVQGVNGLNLSAGSDFTANLAYLQVRAGDVASHIHLDTGNNSAYDLIVGDDQNYVQVSSTGNILLSSYDSNTSQYTWTLDYNGNLILAGGNSVIQSIANSSLDPLNPNVSTMALTPDANYSSQALVLDPTAPGHIHLRSPGANIDEPSANLFLGGENTSFEVGAFYGATPNAYVHSGGNTWTFASDGNLIFPRDANINTDPYLRINGGATPTIISEDTSLAGPANLAIVSDYLTLQGYSESITIRNNDGTFSGSPNLSLSLNAYDDGDSPTVQLINWNSTSGFPTTIVSSETDQVALTTNVSSPSPYSWTFDNAGNLTVPGPIKSANNLDLYAGDAVTIVSNNTGTTNTWTFDETGNLIIPGSSGGVIKTVANGAIGIAAIDGGTDNPAQLLSINANGTATTAISSYANLATIQANINGDIKTWAFTNTGNLTLPGNTLAINYANGTAAFGNIVSVNKDGNSSNVLYGNGVFAAAPGGSSYGDSNVTTLLGSFGSNTISTTGNISGGNVTASGTSSNLIRRAFGLVASDVGVTLDDLTVTVSSATSQLTLSTSGSWQGTGWTETFAGGATPTVNSWVNLPLNPGFNNASGAMNSQGNGCRCVISDQTPTAKVYQITVVRSGTSGAQWNISIERLV